MQNGSILAAVDLGSNSFRLELGRLDHGQIHRTEYIKETVRQGNGLDENRNLTPDAMQRGWDCLARFAERMAGLKKTNVRAVATQTLREARNRGLFIDHAQKILGFPIEIISGREEARLIYLGVSHYLPQSSERRLVIDIGGRSTEIILGQYLEPKVMESYRTGSVAWSMKYFNNGEFTAAAFERAEIAAKAVLDEALSLYPKSEWDQAYGSSGTVGAVVDILAANGWPSDEITQEGLQWLQKTLVRSQSPERLKLEGLKEDRKAVIGGGIGVLKALFDLLKIEKLHCAQGALRHGVLYDLIERDELTLDARELTVKRLQKTFAVDLNQSARVTDVSQFFMNQISCVKVLEQDNLNKLKKKLQWAAQLHEIGSAISHSDYHKHGAYILDQSDAPGFSVSELHRLSLLVLGHRGKLRKLEVDFDDQDFCYQLICLRLAVILCHARRTPEFEKIRLVIDPDDHKCFVLEVSQNWKKSFPQSAHLLHEEVQAWLKTSWHLKVQEPATQAEAWTASIE